MEAARAWGVPPSVLKGRVVAPGTSLWTPNDTALAVALQRLESLQCGGCGQDRRVSMDPASEFQYQAEAMRCHACAARERAAAASAKQGVATTGLQWIVTRTEPTTRGGVADG